MPGRKRRRDCHILVAVRATVCMLETEPYLTIGNSALCLSACLPEPSQFGREQTQSWRRQLFRLWLQLMVKDFMSLQQGVVYRSLTHAHSCTHTHADHTCILKQAFLIIAYSWGHYASVNSLSCSLPMLLCILLQINFIIRTQVFIKFGGIVNHLNS